MADTDSITMGGRDLYLRVEDRHGAVSYRHHSVWNRELFISGVEKAEAKEGGKVEVVDRATYDGARELNRRHA